jgi:hypothetical protein
VIVPDFPELFEDFRNKQFPLLWRGSRDGFTVEDFHSRCDGRPNTLTVILESDRSIFGGFSPVTWDSTRKWKVDPSLKSFLFTLRNPYSVPARQFALKAEKKDRAIYCSSTYGPDFGDIQVFDHCRVPGEGSRCFSNCGLNLPSAKSCLHSGPESLSWQPASRVQFRGVAHRISQSRSVPHFEYRASARRLQLLEEFRTDVVEGIKVHPQPNPCVCPVPRDRLRPCEICPSSASSRRSPMADSRTGTSTQTSANGACPPDRGRHGGPRRGDRCRFSDDR